MCLTEWLFYNKEMSGQDWKGNRKDWSTLEGVTDGMPQFQYEIEPSTQKVIPGTTQVLEVTKEYTIPFTKASVESISDRIIVRVTSSTTMTDKGGKEEKDVEEVKILIRDIERDTAKYLIGVLQAVVNEQVQTRALQKETGNYTIDAVKDQVRRKGWNA